jgi:hypothetical protein
LELDAMVEAVHDWKQTQFLHVFQQQLLTGKRLTPPESVNPQPSEPVPEITPASQRRSMFYAFYFNIFGYVHFMI